MGAIRNIVCLLVIVQLGVNTYAQYSKRFFRKDYTFLNSTESFYKIHTLHRTWSEAKRWCEMEGASFFYPEDDNEAREVLAFWKGRQHFSWVYIGVSDLVAKGVYETVDGRPIMDVYSNWDAGEPNDAGGVEDCVILLQNGKLNDDQCNKKNPFICKKPLADLQWNTECDMPRTDYVYSEPLGHCYKFHNDPKTWTEAVTVCSAEQSYLAVINSQAEAECLVQFSAQKKKNNTNGITTVDEVFLGFHNRNGEGWKTIKGENIEDSGYSTWGAGKPDGGDSQQCGAMFMNGELDDLGCDQRAFYICKHDIASTQGQVNVRFNNLPVVV